MKKSICLLLTVVMLLSAITLSDLFTVNAQGTGEVYTSGNYEYVMAGNKASIVKYLGQEESVIIPSEIDGYTVTIIDGAFMNNKKLTSVDIPNTVISITNQAFLNCAVLQSIQIPDSVTEIGSMVFSGCTSLESITLPKSITEISDGLFNNCASLNSITIPDSVNTIGYCGFYNCISLQEVDMPDELIEIGDSAFSNCRKLQDLVFPDKLQKIGHHAFANCQALKQITIPESVSLIKEYTFSKCIALQSITIPPNVIEIHNSVFSECNYPITVIGEANSEAERIANEYGYPFVPVGEEPVIPPTEAPSSTPTQVPTVPPTEPVTENPTEEFTEAPTETPTIIPTEVQTEAPTEVPTEAATEAPTIPPTEPEPTNPPLIHEEKYRELSDGTMELYYYSDNSSDSIDLVIPSTHEGKAVTKIAAYTFADNNRIASVAIPESIVSIGDGAFAGCTNLKTINFNAKRCTYMGNYHSDWWDERTAVFGDCSVVAEINIGDHVEIIPDFAFAGIKDLHEITVPESVTSIGRKIFLYESIDLMYYNAINCTQVGYTWYDEDDTRIYDAPFYNIQTLIIGDSVEQIDSKLFSKTSIKRLSVGKRLKTISDYCFKDNLYLEKVTLSEGITDIGANAFSGCSKLAIIDFPKTIETVGDYAFDGTAWLDNQPEGIVRLGKTLYAFKSTNNPKDIVIENGIERISAGAFSGSNIASITIPDSVTKIGASAFYDCTELRQVNLGNGIKTIAADSFYGSGIISITIPDNVNKIEEEAFANCTKLTQIYFGSGLMTIAPYAFMGSSINSISIPDSVTEIGQGAFLDCSELKEVHLGNGITEIKNRTFMNCAKLEAINIPNSVTALYSYGRYDRWDDYNDGAFENCSNLKYIYIPDSVRIIDDEVFMNCTSLGSVRMSNNISQIGKFAFMNTALKDITIRNTEVTISDKAFGYITEESPYYAERIDDFSMFGYKRSTAEVYAFLNRFEFVELSEEEYLGDVDGDGSVSIIDATCIQRHLASLPVAFYNESAADTDGDGSVTIIDATCIQRWLASLPCPNGIGEPIK